MKAEGILGLLGASYVFDHWSGYPTAASSLRLVANGPRVATAIWRQDYGLVYVNLTRVVLSLGAGITAAVAVRGEILLRAQRAGKREARVSPLDFRTLFPRRSFSSANPGKSDPPGQTQANKRPRGTANPSPATRVHAPATQTARPEPPPILCTSCEAENASTNKFCEKCGRSLRRPPAARVPAPATQTAKSEPPPIFCTSCEAENASTNKFCEKCGKNLLRSKLALAYSFQVLPSILVSDPFPDKWKGLWTQS